MNSYHIMFQMPTEPIPSIIYSYIKDEAEQFPIDNQKEAFDALIQYLEGKISEKQANFIVFKNIGSTSIVDKITAILTISPDPIPAPENNVKDTKTSGNKTHKAKMWSAYEDQRLLAAIHNYGLDKWIQVSEFIGNGRTRAQCSQRWSRGLDPHIYKGPWTKKEDENLLKLIRIYGDKSWKKVSFHMGNRSDAQCRYHFQQLQKTTPCYEKNIITYGAKYPESKNAMRSPQIPLFNLQTPYTQQIQNIQQHQFPIVSFNPIQNSKTVYNESPIPDKSHVIPTVEKVTRPAENKSTLIDGDSFIDFIDDQTYQFNQDQWQQEVDSFFML